MLINNLPLSGFEQVFNAWGEWVLIYGIEALTSIPLSHADVKPLLSSCFWLNIFTPGFSGVRPREVNSQNLCLKALMLHPENIVQSYEHGLCLAGRDVSDAELQTDF